MFQRAAAARLVIPLQAHFNFRHPHLPTVTRYRDEHRGVPASAAQRGHVRGAAVPGRERLHADLRPDADRQPRAGVALPAGRLRRAQHDRARPARSGSRCSPARRPWASSGCRRARAAAAPSAASRTSEILLTVGLSFIVADLALAVWGGDPVTLDAPAGSTAAPACSASPTRSSASPCSCSASSSPLGLWYSARAHAHRRDRARGRRRPRDGRRARHQRVTPSSPACSCSARCSPGSPVSSAAST